MYLYVVTNPYMQTRVVKVGYMSCEPERIVSRYKTYYGADTTVMCWKCGDAIELERRFKARFSDEHVELELYASQYVMQYVHWITTTVNTTPYVCTGSVYPGRHSNRGPSHVSNRVPSHVAEMEHATPVSAHTRSQERSWRPVSARTRSSRCV